MESFNQTYKLGEIMKQTQLSEVFELFKEKKLCGMFNLSNAAYHSAPGLSRSSLDDLSKGLKYFQWKLGQPTELTEALIFGSAFHTMLLDPEKFDSTFYLNDTQPRSPKLDKDGRQPLGKINHENLKGMTTELKKDPLFEKMIDGIREMSFFCVDPETNVLLKCKPDCILRNGVIVDLKTTKSVDSEDFSKSMLNYKYHAQAAMILDGVKLALEQSGQTLPEGYSIPDAFLFAACEKDEPWDYEFFQCGPQSLVVGESWYKEQLKTYVAAATENKWNPPKRIRELE